MVYKLDVSIAKLGNFRLSQGELSNLDHLTAALL